MAARMFLIVEPVKPLRGRVGRNVKGVTSQRSGPAVWMKRGASTRRGTPPASTGYVKRGGVCYSAGFTESLSLARIIRNLGRGIGALAGSMTCLLWILAIWFPSGGLTISGVSVLVAGFMCLLALLATIASIKGHALVVFVACVASFLPVGAYLLGVEHWLRYVGVLNVALLVAGLLVWVGSRKSADELPKNPEGDRA